MKPNHLVHAGVLAFAAWLLPLAPSVAQVPASGARLAELAGAAQTGATAQTFTLSNGMTLIVQPDRRAPTVVHMVWVRVGSVDEVSGTSGVAHVLEHMMFKGTPTLAEGEITDCP